MVNTGFSCNGNCTELNELTGENNSFRSNLDKIYHYTDFKGLEGILKSRCLWLTDFRYLNDSSEINYSCDKILELIQRIILDLPNLTADIRFWWEQFFHITEKRLKTEFNIYIFSFCKLVDYLPVWRLYANDGCGYAIAFDSNRLLRQDSSSNPLPRIYDEYEVYYGTEKFNTLIKEFIDLSIGEINRADIKKYYGHKKLCFDINLSVCLASHIISLLPRVKHESYQEEHEYRLSEFEFADKKLNELCEIQIPDEKRIWSESNILMPFRNTIPRTISDPFDCDCISEIWVGPGLNFEHAKHQITELLKQYGYKDVEIKQSNIPYRPKK